MRGGCATTGLALAVLLAHVHVHTAGSAVEILEPLDGDRGLDHSFEFHYRAHQRGRVSCFIDGRSVYASDEAEQRLTIPYLPLGFHTLELQLTAPQDEDGDRGSEVGSGESAVLGYDVVEVFVLGDGLLAPEGLDDDARVQQASDVPAIAAAIDAALDRATKASAAMQGGGVGGGEATSELDRAEAELEKIITVLANMPGDLVPRCYYSLAQVLVSRKTAAGLERAIAALREAIWHSPAHGESHHLLAVLLARQQVGSRHVIPPNQMPLAVRMSISC
jgi:hypothetical protein